MRTADALQHLAAYQARIIETLDAVTSALADPPERAREPLAKLRWALSRQLREYQLFKHREIFEPAIRSGGPRHIEQAQRMAAQCMATGDAFQQHVTRWDTQDITAQRRDFHAALHMMVTRLRRAMASERAGVTVLLSGSEQTRRLDG